MSKSLKELVQLLTGSFAGAFFAFAAQTILARNLGPSEYGAFASSLTTATIAASLMYFGIPQLIIRTTGKYGQAATPTISTALNTVTVLTISIVALTIAWAYIGPHDRATASIITLLAMHSICLCAIEMACTKHQLGGNFIALSIWQFMPNLIRFFAISVTIFIFSEKTAQTSAITYAIVAVVIVAISAIPIRKLYTGNITLEGHAPSGSRVEVSAKEVIREAIPLGTFGILNIIYFQSSIVLVNYLGTPEQAGQYGVAFSIMLALYLFPTVIYQKYLLPKLHRWINHEPDKFSKIYRRGNLFMLALGTAAMFLIWATSWLFLPIIFGSKYSSSIDLLNLLAVCAPIQFLVSSVSASLLNHSDSKIKAYCLAITTSASTLLNIILIPDMGAKGAAISNIVSSVLLLGLYQFYAKVIKKPYQAKLTS